MKPSGLEKEFIVIGENIHTTRVLLRKGKLVTTDPDGDDAVRFYDTDKKHRYLKIPEKVKKTQDFQEGRVKHVQVAVNAAMSGQQPQASIGMAYIKRLVTRQVKAGADFLDLNVDEISLKLDEQKAAMKWLVETVEELSSVPVSIDSSKSEIIEEGLSAAKAKVGRMMLNSASLERLDALDLVKDFNTNVVVTAAGESGMPGSQQERVANASRIVEAALEKGIAIQDIYIDPLVFPISVNDEFGNHCFKAIQTLREQFGPAIHITGGFSNVSFGIPSRRLVNDVFLNLAVEAGADSGIIDPVTSHLEEVFGMDRETRSYKLAEDMLLGRDEYCQSFLAAYRNGELE